MKTKDSGSESFTSEQAKSKEKPKNQLVESHSLEALEQSTGKATKKVHMEQAQFSPETELPRQGSRSAYTASSASSRSSRSLTTKDVEYIIR